MLTDTRLQAGQAFLWLPTAFEARKVLAVMRGLPSSATTTSLNPPSVVKSTHPCLTPCRRNVDVFVGAAHCSATMQAVVLWHPKHKICAISLAVHLGGALGQCT